MTNEQLNEAVDHAFEAHVALLFQNLCVGMSGEIGVDPRCRKSMDRFQTGLGIAATAADDIKRSFCATTAPGGKNG